MLADIFRLSSEILIKKQTLAKVLPIGLQDNWFKPALLNDVLKYEGFSGMQLAREIKIEFEADHYDKDLKKFRLKYNQRVINA